MYLVLAINSSPNYIYFPKEKVDDAKSILNHNSNDINKE